MNVRIFDMMRKNFRQGTSKGDQELWVIHTTYFSRFSTFFRTGKPENIETMACSLKIMVSLK